MIRDLPNILTLLRIILIPILIVAFYIEGLFGYWLAAIIFTFAIITDYFDGMLARRLGAHSSFGRIFDPIADKLLVAATLMMLVYYDRAPVIPAILILCREIIVSGLREHLAEFKVSLPVSSLAKIKTAIQFIAILILILGQDVINIPDLRLVGDVAIWVAALLTLFTGFAYLKEGFNNIK